LLAADDTCMVYLKENNRPNPTTCRFSTHEWGGPHPKFASSNTCAGPTVFTAQFCKSASQASRLSLSLISFLTCLFLFLFPFHPAISNNSMQRSSLLPLCYIPFQGLQIICFIIISPLTSHFYFYFCGELFGTIKMAPWLIQRIFLENKSPKFAIFQGKN
jgi:hypothetical protein